MVRRWLSITLDDRNDNCDPPGVRNAAKVRDTMHVVDSIEASGQINHREYLAVGDDIRRSSTCVVHTFYYGTVRRNPFFSGSLKTSRE